MAFFINPPLNSTAGALNPVEAMPAWLQPFTIINPIHHFAVIARASMLKGSGFADCGPIFWACSRLRLSGFAERMAFSQTAQLAG